MPEDKDKKDRKRMVVEEVSNESSLKEKVEELQDLTEDIAESADKSAEVQEDLAETVEKGEPLKLAETPVSTPPSSGPNPLVIIIPGVLLLGALLGGIFFYQKSVGDSPKATPSPTPNTMTEATPTATPTAEVNLTQYSITIENGSGIPGAAGDVKDILTKAGFDVAGTGNADNYNYTDTIIKAKSGVSKAFVTKLTDTLSADYSLGSLKSLPDSSSDDVIVIVGSSKAK